MLKEESLFNFNNTVFTVSCNDCVIYSAGSHFIFFRIWMRNRNTIEYLGIWETLYNPEFKPLEFEGFRRQVGLNAFVLSPQKWVEATGAKGLISKSGRNGGTFAHKDIAFKFASWISTEFELYFIREFQRLKDAEQKLLGWSAKRELAKINYHIHTDAVKQNLVPKELTSKQAAAIYADEADVLNVALFGMTAKEWRTKNPDLKGFILKLKANRPLKKVTVTPGTSYF